MIKIHNIEEYNNCDFNDSYYLAQANINKWKVVTDDADLFKNNNLNVEIITVIKINNRFTPINKRQFHRVKLMRSIFDFNFQTNCAAFLLATISVNSMT